MEVVQFVVISFLGFMIWWKLDSILSVLKDVRDILKKMR